MVIWLSADSVSRFVFFVSRFCQEIFLVSRFTFSQQIFLVSRFTFSQQILSAGFLRQQFRFLSEKCLMFRQMERCHELFDDVFE